MKIKILHEDCDKILSENKSLPTDAYLVTYMKDDRVTYDIARSSARVDIFDHYYDTYGKGALISINWTKGSVNPKLYQVSKPAEKKKNDRK